MNTSEANRLLEDILEKYYKWTPLYIGNDIMDIILYHIFFEGSFIIDVTQYYSKFHKNSLFVVLYFFTDERGVIYWLIKFV